jgi:L-lactate dehydrogenase
MSQVKGESIENFPKFKEISSVEVNTYIHQAAYKIINCVGATYFGIGSAVSEIVDGIVNNRNKLLTTSSIVEQEYGLSNLAIGLPNIVNASGSKIDSSFALNTEENNLLRDSANVILEVIKQSGF